MTADVGEMKDEIARLKLELEEAEKALPAHSVRPGQMMRVMELEEKLAKAEKRLKDLKSA